ncbi:hypothetical protein JEQ12_007184 [Ovis aries]|uniref:Uncharacterized protein n=1 Tax=Ovis aries TaxID=9940 RepID=A0A835ZXH5_SHEEP|nr:hypothetical protein JEQ12_007184 [Ovis aries]
MPLPHSLTPNVPPHLDRNRRHRSRKVLPNLPPYPAPELVRTHASVAPSQDLMLSGNCGMMMKVPLPPAGYEVMKPGVILKLEQGEEPWTGDGEIPSSDSLDQVFQVNGHMTWHKDNKKFKNMKQDHECDALGKKFNLSTNFIPLRKSNKEGSSIGVEAILQSILSIIFLTLNTGSSGGPIYEF